MTSVQNPLNTEEQLLFRVLPAREQQRYAALESRMASCLPAYVPTVAEVHTVRFPTTEVPATVKEIPRSGAGQKMQELLRSRESVGRIRRFFSL